MASRNTDNSELEERFGQSNGVRLYQLQKEVCSITQGNSDVAAYFTKLKTAWDELNIVCNLPKCTCGAVQALLKYEQDQRLIQFLMGLNSDYNVLRGNILVMRPLPTVSEAYGLVIHEEKQKEIQSSSPFMAEHASLNANNQSTFKPTHTAGDYKGKLDNKKQIYCEHCKKPGHSANKCYRLVGYPKDFKFTKGKKVAAQAFSGEESMMTEEHSRGQDNVALYNQFMQFLSTMRAGDQPYKSNGDSKATTFSAHMAVMQSVGCYCKLYPRSVHSAGPFNEEATGSCALTTDSQQFLHSVSQMQEPRSYEEAKGIPAWEEAMQKELQALHDTGTWAEKSKAPITVVDVFKHTKTKKHDGKTWIDPKNAQLETDFIRLKQMAEESGLKAKKSEAPITVVDAFKHTKTKKHDDGFLTIETNG
ncbi:unnamed protein product [Cuscuta campestris]|uniref:Retrotransposon gag domain-containing protein n=1 Tax=Cuscuta campestris TaxID=132261 RepID=A0A484K5H6_9ASTE|nr:unnamed protein product [Cuscuta campestris]